MIELPARKQFEKKLFAREEANGVSVHEPEINTIKFIEGQPISVFDAAESYRDAAGVLRSFEDSGDVSANLDLQRPLRVNWLASLACNLVCVYCYAEDKMDQKRAIPPSVFEGIHELNPLSVSITGGEPLMSPYLIDALGEFDGRYGLILDTNGTVRLRDEMLEMLKQTNTTVRVTIDSTEKELLNVLRPSRSSHEYEPQRILDTISALGQAGIRTAVHTVITSKNLRHLDQIGDALVDMDVKTWQLYPVEFTETYRATYPMLRVTSDQIIEAREALADRYGDSIYVRVYDQREQTDGRSVVMMQNTGEVVLDNIDGGLEVIKSGKNLNERVMGKINVVQHKKDYLYSTQ